LIFLNQAIIDLGGGAMIPKVIFLYLSGEKQFSSIFWLKNCWRI
jgi:hypothetical protein